MATYAGLGYSYAAGSPRYTWLAKAIDGARARGIRWVIVANHKNYVTSGTPRDEVGPAYFNLLLRKRVSLILQGHNHVYSRSKQLALRPGCPAVPAGSVNPACIADSGADGTYSASAGSVLLIDGTGGHSLGVIDHGDPRAGYFARTMGAGANQTYGYTRFVVTRSAIQAHFVPAAGGGFRDAFTIRAG